MTAAYQRRAWVQQIMGMPVSVHVRCDDPSAAHVEHRVAAVFAELRHADAVFSPYRDDSDLSRWQRGELTLHSANVPLTKADAAFAEADAALVKAGAALAEANGTLAEAAAALAEVNGTLPKADFTLAEVVALCEQARLRTGGWFDARADGRTYDPSGLVKGWAVQRAARNLAGLHGYGWCLNAGGDVLVHAPDGRPPWRVGIEDPDRPSRTTGVITVRDGAVATSGTAHRGAHITDPHTRAPATKVRAVTVTGPDLLWADVYATAAAARGTDAIDWLNSLPRIEAQLLTTTGTTHTTTGWSGG
ncbi:FAD:protein FMN transferase [Sphaerisporangium corydalis]|uniref:FAD:protein FMN transferase n=1 Tax=Sphaerisporangium corydalis TaxID=1441875 RepID=A0ABV9E970_9ACTN|nr:FAD:protein FMN transferase [Sphaerisporangium corydalis]